VDAHLSVVVDGRIHVIGGKIEMGGIEQTVRTCFSARY
jgi:hypothetical protein